MADKFIKVENPTSAPAPNIQFGSDLGGVTKLQSTSSLSNRTLTLPDKDGVLATLADAQGSSSALLSAGCTTVPTFTDNGNGTFTVGVGNANIYDNADGAGGLANYTNIAGGTFTPQDLVNNYVVYNYNGGSPVCQCIQDRDLINEITIIPVYTVFRSGNDLDRKNWDRLGYALPNKTHQMLVNTQKFRRQDGLGLGEAATRTVLISAGRVYAGAVPVSMPAFSSAINNMLLATRTGGAWVYTPVTQYNNTQYCDGSDTYALSGSTYAVNFVYYVVQDDADKAIILLGSSNATLEQAVNMQPPSVLPPEIYSVGMLVGRIIVARAANVATRIDSAFNVFWAAGGSSGGVVDHASLNGLQGGQTAQYFHLTGTQHGLVTQIDQALATTSNPTFVTSKVSNGGAGLTTITRAASASNFTFTLPAATGTAALVEDLGAYALKAGDTIGGVVVGADAAGSIDVSAGNGLALRGVTGSVNDFAILTPDGLNALLRNPTGTINLATAGSFTVSATTPSTTTGTGSIVTPGGLGVGENINAGGHILGNNLRVNAGSTGVTTIERAASASNYTATLPAKSGTFVFSDDLTIANVSGLQTALNGKEPTISAGTTAQYWRGDKSWQTLNTTAVTEGTNLYFTNARTLATPLSGFTVGSNATIAATDTVLGAFGKTQGQLNAKANLSGATFTGGLSVNNATTTVGDSPVITQRSRLASRLVMLRDAAHYTLDAVSVTGIMKITLPNGFSNTMTSLRVIGYNFNSLGGWELWLGGYTYQIASQWQNTFARMSSGSLPSSLIRFGIDAGGKVCILLGDTTTVWDYPKIVITEALLGYSGADATAAPGWSISLITDTTGIVVTSTPTLGTDSTHTHPISAVTGLQTALDSKANLAGATFTGVVKYAQYTVGTLPAAASNQWAIVTATNGRWPGQGAGAGTGVAVQSDGTIWRSLADGLQVLA